jgi:hypothetical protein
VGSWDSLFEMLPADADGNIILSGDHFGMDTRNSLVFGDEDRSRLIVTLGVKNLVIVDTENVLLVCSIEEAQRIREVVKQLKGEKPEYLKLRRYPLEAYCMKCKTKREMKDPQPVFTAQGAPATRGVCPHCGTTLYRMGRTDAHEGMSQPEKKKSREGKLVIVESPAKARTVGRFLGKGFTVKASVGHVRDLLRSQLSIDVEKLRRRVPNDKRPV